MELKQDISLCNYCRPGTLWGSACPEGLGAARAAASGSDSGAGASSELTPVNVPLRRLVLELDPRGGPIPRAFIPPVHPLSASAKQQPPCWGLTIYFS